LSETYVSIDVEADGPVPGLFSMLSLGAAAFSGEGEELGRWEVNLRPLPNAGEHPHTMQWWRSQENAYRLATADQRDPAEAMATFVAWVEELPGLPLAAADPVAFDFSFVNWYCFRFVGRNPLGHHGLDIRSLAMGLTHSRAYHDLPEAAMKPLLAAVDREGLVQHRALDDAVEQGRLLCALIAETRGGSRHLQALRDIMSITRDADHHTIRAVRERAARALGEPVVD
jgi:hypothetical protein